MYNATSKNRSARPNKYRDEWEDEELMLEAHMGFRQTLPERGVFTKLKNETNR